MVEMSVFYQGEKHCELKHGPSGITISTDAPKDNNGRGEAFSPTDLCAVSLGTCMMTVMAIQAEKEGQSLSKMKAIVKKNMQVSPRKISKIEVQIEMPAALDQAWRDRLETIALNCPVKLSLHPEVLTDIQFIYV